MSQRFSATFTGQPSVLISPRDLVAPLFRRQRILAITFLSIVAIIVLASFVWPAPYKAQMSILVNHERLDPIISTESSNQTPIYGNNEVSLEEINSEAELLKSRDVLEKVVQASGLAKPHGVSLFDWIRPRQTDDDRLARAVRQLAKDLKIEIGSNSNIIYISYSSHDPTLCYSVLSNLGRFYLEKHMTVHRPPGSFEFFSEETTRYQRELAESEQRLRDFAVKRGGAAPNVVQADLAQQLSASIGQLHGVQELIATDQQRIRSDEQQLSVTPQRSPTLQASSPPDKLLDDLNAALLAAQAKRTQLSIKYDAGYPLVQEADAEVAQAKSAITKAEQMKYVTDTTDRDPTFELLREDLAKSRTDLAGQLADLAATKRSITSLQAQLVDLDQAALTEDDLRRNEKADEGNYLLYLSKREQARTSEALDKTRIANVAIAVPPSLPVLPVYGISLVIIVALGAGMTLGIGAAYGADFLDPTFHTPSQVLSALDIPVVISLPTLANGVASHDS